MGIISMLRWAKDKPQIEFVLKETEDIFFLGESAQRCLENAAFNAAIKRIEEDYFRMWKNSKPLDADGREAIWRGLQAIAEVKIKLQGLLNQMVMEKAKKEEEKLAKNRMKPRFDWSKDHLNISYAKK